MPDSSSVQCIRIWREIHAVFWVIFYPVWLLPLLQAVGGIIEGGPEICQSKVIFSMRMALLEIQAWLLCVLLFLEWESV